MALTKAQWLAKLTGWVPEVIFREERLQIAHFKGIAGDIERLQLDADDHVAETFILNAIGDLLDEHGRERDVIRLTGEVDAVYRPRVQKLTNQSNCPAIKELVDTFLVQGESQVVEHETGRPFFDRDAFLDRAAVFSTINYNAFSILVDRQVHDPFSFFGPGPNRDSFLNRDVFIGTNISSQSVFDLIADTVNKNKAYGVLYRIIEAL